MAFDRENFNVARKTTLAKGEVTVECNISAGVNVSKVLAVSVEGYGQNVEALNGVVNYSGAVDAKLVIMAEDGQINTVCNSCPFSSRFESEEIENGQDAFVKVKVVDYIIESVGGEMVKLAVVLEQNGFVVGNQEIGTIDCHDDDICFKKDDISVIKYVGSSSSEVALSSEINLRENIKKILLVESRAVVKNVDAGADFVTVSGDVVTRVLYVNENDKFESGYINDTFKEEVELSGVTRESFVEGDAFVKHDGVETEIVQDEKGGKIIVKVPLVLKVRAFQEGKISVINDLYSVKNELNVTTSSFSMTSIYPMGVAEGKIEGSLTLEENMPRVDKLLFNGGNGVVVTNYYLKDNEVFVEGIARSTAVYLNDEDSSLHSVQIDVPFIISDKFNAENEGGVLSVDAVATDVDVVVKKGREIYYDAKIKACVNYSCQLSAGVISEASVMEEYGNKDYAMEVIFAPSGSELWNVAKSARVKEEQILMQNPEVSFPTENNTPLVLFYQRVQ